jgi:hypothetical protein
MFFLLGFVQASLAAFDSADGSHCWISVAG